MEALLTILRHGNLRSGKFIYGITCAGAPSFHGSYEAPVPSQLRKQD